MTAISVSLSLVVLCDEELQLDRDQLRLFLIGLNALYTVGVQCVYSAVT